jgi:hypothetical protein
MDEIPGLRPGLLWSDLSISFSSARIRRLFWRDALLSGHGCFSFLLIQSVKGAGCRGSAAATIDHSVIRAFYKPHDK